MVTSHYTHIIRHSYNQIMSHKFNSIPMNIQKNQGIKMNQEIKKVNCLFLSYRENALLSHTLKITQFNPSIFNQNDKRGYFKGNKCSH